MQEKVFSHPQPLRRNQFPARAFAALSSPRSTRPSQGPLRFDDSGCIGVTTTAVTRQCRWMNEVACLHWLPRPLNLKPFQEVNRHCKRRQKFLYCAKNGTTATEKVSSAHVNIHKKNLRHCGCSARSVDSSRCTHILLFSRPSLSLLVANL